MKIALIGATGYVGSAILKEALNRGHEVTAIARHPEKLSRHESLIVKKGDLFNIDELCQSIKRLDAVISAFNAFSSGSSSSDNYNAQIEGIKLTIKAAKKSGVNRLLVVGGAGSLENKEGVQLVDTAEFPQEWKDMALSMRESLDILKNEKELKWTFLSPSALLKPGERTGKFKLGENQLIVDIKGESKISVEDYAMAMIDELENPKHTNKRFTVGYCSCASQNT